MDYVEFFQKLENYGFSDALLPFLLVFVLIYAVLQKSQILGENKKNFNVIIAMIFGMLVVFPHITGGYQRMGVPDVVDLMNQALPQIVIFVVGVLLLFIILGLFGVRGNWPANKASGMLVVAALGIIVYVFGATPELGWWNKPNWSWWTSDTVSFVVIALVFVVILFFITRDDHSPKEGLGTWMSSLGEHLKGGGGGGHH